MDCNFSLIYFGVIEKLKRKANNNLQKNSIKKNSKRNFNFKNPISNFLRDRYIKICKNLFLKYFENNFNNKKIVDHLINKIEPKYKNLF